MNMSELSQVEQIVYRSIGSMWRVYGHGSNNWHAIRVVIDAQETLAGEFAHLVTSPESLLISEVKEELNFLWWLSHTIEYGA